MRTVLLLFLALLCPSLLAAVDVRGVQVSQAPGGARVAIELSAAAGFEWFTLADPDRVVVDLRQARAPGKLTLAASGGGLVTGLRHARRGEDGLRIVLDMQRPVRVQAVLEATGSGDGRRLLLALTGSPADASAGAPPARAAPSAAAAVPARREGTLRMVMETRLARSGTASAAADAAPALMYAAAPVAGSNGVTGMPMPVPMPGPVPVPWPAASERERLEAHIAELQRVKAEYERVSQDILREQARLEQRVKELEVARASDESATRSIIRESLTSVGSNVNETVALGGSLEIAGGWKRDFTGQSEGILNVSTAELDLEIKANEWTLGQLVLDFNDGTGRQFATSDGGFAGVDRISVNTARLTVGNTQKFPAFLRAGRGVVPFGIATGRSGADVLTINDPMTIEVFETREDSVHVGVAFPTPEARPPTPPVAVPRVESKVLRPVFEDLAGALGYSPPPTRPPAPNLVSAPQVPPPFGLGAYFYNGATVDVNGSSGFDPGHHMGLTSEFHARGRCGRRLDEPLPFHCPWTLDLTLDYNRSVFDSDFLTTEYASFQPQFGFVGGLAAAVKSTLGPVSFVGEWNGAIETARFTDDTGMPISIRPRVWQGTLGYQFDWNPWIDKIGDQGTYVTVGYSRSSDLAGVTRTVLGEATRVGTVPRHRFLLGFGEWLLDGLRFAVEYSHEVDYPVSDGGTGRRANAVVSSLNYVW